MRGSLIGPAQSGEYLSIPAEDTVSCDQQGFLLREAPVSPRCGTAKRQEAVRMTLFTALLPPHTHVPSTGFICIQEYFYFLFLFEYWVR